jgi:Flp pilus assembly protein TadD
VRLADGYYGHGNYSKAAELYRLGLQKGSVDSNLANTRLGIALAMAGQKAEAETAFNAVTGPRKDLASFWTLWLSQPR